VKRIALLALAAACGDNGDRVEVFTATSGTRLALQKYRFDDGTEQTSPGDVYDKELHTNCIARVWVDGATRCVPVADDAVYTDAACTSVIGRSITMEKPTHFIVYENTHGMDLPAHVFRAGMATDPVTEYFVKQDDRCFGPFSAPSDGVTYFTVGDEIDGATLPAIVETEVGDGPLALALHTSDDGLRVPFELRDRELDVPCTPALRGDGSFVCAPLDTQLAFYFADPACTMPVVIGDAPPAIVEVSDDAGCTAYRRNAGEIAPQAYMRSGASCVPANLGSGDHVYAVGDPIELPVLTRTLDGPPGRRLQQVILDDGALHFYDDRLFDTATRADCRRMQVGDVTRCLPAALATASSLFTAGCAVPVAVTDLPRRLCERPAFAAANSEVGLEVRAIGDPIANPLFVRSGGQCLPFSAGSDNEVRTVGPPLDPTTFEGAIEFGER